jgi:hypothetical protein
MANRRKLLARFLWPVANVIIFVVLLVSHLWNEEEEEEVSHCLPSLTFTINLPYCIF